MDIFNVYALRSEWKNWPLQTLTGRRIQLTEYLDNANYKYLPQTRVGTRRMSGWRLRTLSEPAANGNQYFSAPFIHRKVCDKNKTKQSLCFRISRQRLMLLLCGIAFAAGGATDRTFARPRHKEMQCKVAGIVM